MKIRDCNPLPFALLFAVLTLSSSVIQMVSAASWLTNSPMNTQRDTHTATVLTNGRVLIVGGRNGVGSVRTDPASGTGNFNAMSVKRYNHKLNPFNSGGVCGGCRARETQPAL